MTKLHQLAALGQSIWLDYIQRSFISSGGLQNLIDLGLRGVTSNPTIFEKAIASDRDYDPAIQKLVATGYSTLEIYDALTIEDIQQAADLFRPLYTESQSLDGYVSLEVNPKLARNTQATVREAQRLWKLVNRPNLLIKIPATNEGIPAIRQTIFNGINVNVTLIFSVQRYREVALAYIQGLEDRLQNGLSIQGIASVASVFVSRLDSKVENKLAKGLSQADQPRIKLASQIKGKTAIANAALAYAEFQNIFYSNDFAPLKSLGAQYQRPLWASTSTKNPAMSDILYVQELIAPFTVNTTPQETINAFLDHGEVRLTIQDQITQAAPILQSLAELGISIDEVTQELENEAVIAFESSFDSLIKSLDEKRKILTDQAGN